MTQGHRVEDTPVDGYESMLNLEGGNPEDGLYRVMSRSPKEQYDVISGQNVEMVLMARVGRLDSNPFGAPLSEASTVCVRADGRFVIYQWIVADRLELTDEARKALAMQQRS